MSAATRPSWRFVVSRRWFGYLALAIVFAVACVLLSRWQVARLDEAASTNRLVTSNWNAEPVALDSLLAPSSAWDDSLEYRPVELDGVYDVSAQTLVRNRPYNGNPGFDVLTPLRLDDGTWFVVDRGWVPVGSTQDSPDSVPAPPSGEVTVVARLKPGEGRIDGRTAPAGQISTIQLDDLANEIGEPLRTAAYGLLVAEAPAPSVAAPLGAIKPVADEGLHISYAIQWVLFAIMGFGGLGWAIRHEYRLRNADDPEVIAAQERREERRRRRGRSDAEVEDELLDAR
ncbi:MULTISPECIES: SURF1 family protein [unclassified Rathayibacter]|uniref:SURF1 family cytochrome oxidase biogenesis protein n=1 Tax=unclassified Rathayibacter TaxID=2609250 RepID=UPI00188A7693|nr:MULTISPECIES: SURF1 family protein [unclassified Rathayibacter]MBF4462372.1 SURF1 family protein [Rathayibacter sp. VKM Ac-2879]MBF4503585.1 SURF1 family protein [Rathayibacter sp. VKM Ac-2878]